MSRLARVATISVHTSPLDQPGTGDAGGMNVYIVEVAKRMAERGIEVDLFTRATSRLLPPVTELAPGVLVRHVAAGPFEELDKTELPRQMCAFTSGLLRTEAAHEPGHYDLIHSHYWLSGQAGHAARMRWGVPLVHSMHTLAKVKNAALADGDTPEPLGRVAGRAAGRGQRRPPHRQHRGRGGPAPHALRRRRRSRWRPFCRASTWRRSPRRRPARAVRPLAGAPPPRPARRHGRCCCSSAASSR